jgi:hypothetical protein
MKIPKELNRVTPLSRGLAVFLFVIMPFVGFLIGMRFQERVDKFDPEINHPLLNMAEKIKNQRPRPSLTVSEPELNFEQSYKDSDYCNFNNNKIVSSKTECVVSTQHGTLVPGKDGQADCMWNASTHSCVANK